MTGNRRVRLTIRGHVQGVNFRYFARQQAQSLHLGGWIRNCPDGSVETEVEGHDDAVQRFCDWARTGPSAATVDELNIQPVEPGGADSFRIVP